MASGLAQNLLTLQHITYVGSGLTVSDLVRGRVLTKEFGLIHARLTLSIKELWQLARIARFDI
jgi:hypothetical protein